MSANQAGFPITVMAGVLGVSKAEYYAWAGREPWARAVADAALLKRIRTVHLGSHATDGAPRVHADPREQGVRHSRKRIARMMREAGLVGASHRRGALVTTRRDPAARPSARRICPFKEVGDLVQTRLQHDVFQARLMAHPMLVRPHLLSIPPRRAEFVLAHQTDGDGRQRASNRL